MHTISHGHKTTESLKKSRTLLCLVNFPFIKTKADNFKCFWLLLFITRLVESIQSFDEAPSQKVSRCPTGKHVSNNVNIFKCACLVSEEEVERYDAHIDNGRRLESEGKAEEAFKQYMCALELKDSDIKLHLRTLQLAQGFKELLY